MRVFAMPESEICCSPNYTNQQPAFKKRSCFQNCSNNLKFLMVGRQANFFAGTNFLLSEIINYFTNNLSFYKWFVLSHIEWQIVKFGLSTSPLTSKHEHNKISVILCMSHYLSHDMTKPTKWVCAQRRLRSAWASAQSDQSLRCLHKECLGP